MITITRKYHFYAAHRNEMLVDKCYSIHGHTYRVEVELKFAEPTNYPPGSGVAMLFGDIDKKILPYIERWDHSFLIHRNDPLYVILDRFNDDCIDKLEQNLKLCAFDFPTSVENLTVFLYKELLNEFMPWQLGSVSIQETDSSKVKYQP